MAETHHYPHDGCEACLRAEKAAGEEGLIRGSFFLGVEKTVRVYESLPAVNQARQDGTLAQCFTDFLADHNSGQQGHDRLVEALAAALAKIEG